MGTAPSCRPIYDNFGHQVGTVPSGPTESQKKAKAEKKKKKSTKGRK